MFGYNIGCFFLWRLRLTFNFACRTCGDVTTTFNIDESIFRENQHVVPGTAALSIVHRRLLDLSLNQEFKVVPFRTIDPNIYLILLRLDVDFLAKSKKKGSSHNTFFTLHLLILYILT